MPVKWIADRGQRRGGLPRLGKIKKGEPAKDDKSFPTNQDRFRLLSEQARVAKAWEEIFGKEPLRSFTAYLPYQDMRANWDYWYESWTAGGLVFRCDGEQVVLKKLEGRYVEAWEPCPYHVGGKERTRKDPGDQLIGRLTVIIPAFLERGIVGTFTLETGSSNDCSNWDAALEAAAARNGGDCRGIPFRIYRSKETIWKVANGKRWQEEDWLVRIEPEAQWLAERLGSSDVAEGDYNDDMPDIDPETGEVGGEPPFAGTDPLETGEPTPGPTQSGAKQDTAPSTGRPYDPDKVRKGIQARIKDDDGAPPENGLRGLTVGTLNGLWPRQETETQAFRRHAVTKFLIGKEESATWSRAECEALLAWAGTESAKDPSKTISDPVAMEEAALILLRLKVPLNDEMPF